MGRDITDSDSEISICSKGDDSIESSQLHIKPTIIKESKQHPCDFPECHKVFNRPWKLLAHNKLHYNKRPYVCKEGGCSRAFSNTSHLKRHVRTSHENLHSYHPIKCTEPGCDALLKTKQFLQRHLKRKHTDLPFKCNHCEVAFKRSRNLKEHMFIHTGIHPFVCSTCSKGFEKNYDLQRHMRGHRTYSCRLDNCTEILQSMSSYRKHIAQFHKPKPMCEICDKMFSTNSNLKTHMLTHSEAAKTWACTVPDCDQSFTQEKYLKQHFEHVHNRQHQYQCQHQHCDKFFHWKKNYAEHLKLHSVDKSVKKSKRPRRERKDKGKSKKSVAAELANVLISQKSHNKLISKDCYNNQDGNISDASVMSEILYLPLKDDAQKEKTTTILSATSL